MKIAVVSEDKKGLEGRVASRFGRAPYFVIIELGGNGEVEKVEIVENPGAQAASGAGVKAVQKLVDEGVEIAVAPSFGPNAQAILEEMRIKTVTVQAGISIREAIDRVKENL